MNVPAAHRRPAMPARSFHRLGFALAPLALAALLAACGGGGDAGGPPTASRAAVAKETVQNLQGAAVDGVPGAGYVHVCPGLNDEGRRRHVLIKVGGFSPNDTDRQPAAGELDSTCAGIPASNDFHTLVVRYRHGADLIQRNAGFVRAVLEWAIARYGLTADDRVALQGTSMGGVVTRHALQSMDTDGVPHLVDLWLSIDAPQRGAYIPIGVQHLADLFRDFGGGEALAAADTPAARQMLTHHYTQGTSTQTATDAHRRLYTDELNGTLGGFPRSAGLRRVAVASGRVGGTLQAPMPGQRYVAGRLQVYSDTVQVRETRSEGGCTATARFDLPIVSTVLAEAFPLGLNANQSSLVARSDVKTTVAGYDVDTQVDGLTRHVDARVTLTGVLGVCNLFGAPIKRDIVDQTVRAAVARAKREAAPYVTRYEKSYLGWGDGIQSEGAPGGRSNAIEPLRDALTRAGFSQETGVAGDGTHMFISVASALNIPTSTANMDRDALRRNSPFDAVYVEPDRNLDHIDSTSGYLARELGVLFAR